MSERDYNRQVEKRQRISETTLVVGVDVGNAFNAVGFMNKEGKVLSSCAKQMRMTTSLCPPSMTLTNIK